MKSFRWLSSCALALSLVPSLASADEPSLVERTKRRVQEGIVKPLANREASRFSRMRPEPRERRVRVTQAAGTPDKNGREFVSFSIDVRYGSEWHANDIEGCAYTKSGELFVKNGDDYRPAAFLLGKNVGPVEGVCRAVPPRAKASS